MFIKGIVQPKKSFCHHLLKPHVISNLYEFHSSMKQKHKRRNFEECYNNHTADQEWSNSKSACIYIYIVKKSFQIFGQKHLCSECLIRRFCFYNWRHLRSSALSLVTVPQFLTQFKKAPIVHNHVCVSQHRFSEINDRRLMTERDKERRQSETFPRNTSVPMTTKLLDSVILKHKTHKTRQILLRTSVK